MGRALQHEELVAQGKDFGLESSPAAQQSAKKGKEKAQGGEHGERDSLSDIHRKVNAFNQNGIFDRDTWKETSGAKLRIIYIPIDSSGQQS